MALEWLKTILGDAFTEDIETKVSAEIGKGFVSREDYNRVNGEKATLTTELKAAQDTIAGFPAQDTIAGFPAQDTNTLRQERDDWKQKAEAADEKTAQAIAAFKFDSALDTAIMGTKGRAVKPIRALLDVEQLRASENQEDAIKTALEQLKHENGYLFEDGETPPPYAAGTGTMTMPAFSQEASAFRAGAGAAEKE